MPRFGFPELFVSFVVLVAYAVPIAVAIWIILALRHIRSDVITLKGELEEIKRLLLSKN